MIDVVNRLIRFDIDDSSVYDMNTEIWNLH